MANSFKHQDKEYRVGDTIKLSYKFQEGDKVRNQVFSGILLKIKGKDEHTRMITIRRMSKTGIGIERLFPLNSPNITQMSLEKKSTYRKAKLYFVRNLSEQKLRHKIYKSK